MTNKAFSTIRKFTLRTDLILIFLLIPFFSPFSKAWSNLTPVEGIRENTPTIHAFIDAKIIVQTGDVIEKGTLVIRDSVIEAVGESISPPADARIHDCKGLVIYPGFIESYSHLGIADNNKEGMDHWNANVHPESRSVELYEPSEEELETYRSIGFTSAHIAPKSGIFRGSSMFVSLGDEELNDLLLRENVAQHLAFQTSRDRSYPNSLMGVFALIRQTFLDAEWYDQAHAVYNKNPQTNKKPEINESLAEIAASLSSHQPYMIECRNPLALFRAAKLAKEFNLKLWVRGSGLEYERLNEIKDTGIPIILPIDFPENPAVAVPEESLNVSLKEMMHWEMASYNPRMLHEAGIQFSLTTAQLKNVKDFPKMLRTAILHGLPKEAALEALTTVPAKLFGVEDQVATLEEGKLAHFIISDGEPFEEKAKILDVWVNGKRFEIEKKPAVDPRGTWLAEFSEPAGIPTAVTLEFKGKVDNVSGNLIHNASKIELENSILTQKRIAFTVSGDDLGMDGIIRFSGKIEEKTINGSGELPNGKSFTWNAVKQEKEDTEEDKNKKETEDKKTETIPQKPIVHPFGAYGRPEPPKQPEHLLIRHATIWTCGPDGIFKNADILVTKGKITKIGYNLQAPETALIIDAKGKHITPGLIDCHTHLATDGSFNETGQTISAECRVHDVLNGDQIALYRNLAGGLTTINTLHGSANPIGGQNAVIKLRWGTLPDEMLFQGADPSIKFALGENVKQSNWSERTNRYPQTRMGVEQIIRDRFKAAQDYQREWKDYESSENRENKIPPRRDLELEALAEVLQQKRFIQCHAYRQDEILMLIRLAETFGFTIRTFEHTLEGYKIAESLAKHGVGASVNSDWWAYKFEVYDAIPYNGSLMHDAGVLVSFNSDTTNGELTTRMNLEAAKAVKYHGIDEQEALKFVTLNPAKKLGIDKFAGSLEPGKDADIVIWNGPPLSTLTKCEQTWIDGRKYFDIGEDRELRKQAEKERARLIQKILSPDKKKK